LFLVKNGVPFDVAFSLPVRERLAWVVIMGMFDGGVFDWSIEHWRERQ
jgi:hypothetical protein